uniref:Uncharacterized protein n=1 Tax=mine drainage metagenome TaxID=410659 RepID=E6PX00_9ZZZZ
MKEQNVSRAAWANMQRVNPLAAIFVELVTRYPDTIERLQMLPRRHGKVHTWL